MPFRFKEPSFALEIVGFAVVNDPKGPVAALQRLVAGGTGINNGKTRHAKRNLGRAKNTIIIRPPMVHCCHHRFYGLRIATAPPNSTDPAHAK